MSITNDKMQLIIREIQIKDCETRSRLEFQVFERGNRKNVFFEVDKQYRDFLCCERCDAIVIGLLNYAMRNNLHFQSDIPMTEQLHYNIKNILIPALAKSDSRMHFISLDIPTAPALDNAGAVGTGISGGIDSFYTVLSNTNTEYKSFNLTHLFINNVGAFNDCYKKSGAENVKKISYERAKMTAEKFNLPLLMTDSNFAEEFPQNHLLTHTYSSVFAVYCLQKLLSIYYYSSAGFPLEESFSLTDNSLAPAGKTDLLSLNCFSHSKLRLYSAGYAENRMEKTEYIADNEIVHQHLFVCARTSSNCGMCTKCRRTILSLYALGKLEKFRDAFDVDYFHKHKTEYLEWLYRKHLKKYKMTEPIYNILKKEFTCFFKLKFFLSKLFSVKTEKRQMVIRILFAKFTCRTSGK